ncbi:MAG: preprotein translocase subunit SecG [Verrucomicrobia bacterium]|nr:preprotein translocase subunit SecG [Verrucomicrobiota bacterium]NBU69471.1 preprotein translocase subunit SecG [Verrucomicrobiota bacterium]
MINIAIYILLGVNLLVCVLLTLLVLMQKPRSEGLGAAFGGSFTDSIFGAQTSDVLTKGTIWLGSTFMLLTLVLALLYSHRQTSGPKLQEELTKPVAATTNNLSTNAVAPSPAETSAPVNPAPANP